SDRIRIIPQSPPSASPPSASPAHASCNTVASTQPRFQWDGSKHLVLPSHRKHESPRAHAAQMLLASASCAPTQFQQPDQPAERRPHSAATKDSATPLPAPFQESASLELMAAFPEFRYSPEPPRRQADFQ